MNIFDNIFSGSNGIANKLIDIFGTEAYYVRSNNDKTYDPKTDTYTNNEEIRKLITITPPSKYKSYELVNSSIKSTDCKCIVKATDIEYEIKNNSDYIEYKGEKYIIVEKDALIYNRV